MFNFQGYLAYMLIARYIEAQVLHDLTYFPAIGILGPRQVGKTTFAKTLQARLTQPSVYLDLEDEATFSKLSEPGTYLPLYQDHYSSRPMAKKLVSKSSYRPALPCRGGSTKVSATWPLTEVISSYHRAKHIRAPTTFGWSA